MQWFNLDFGRRDRLVGPGALHFAGSGGSFAQCLGRLVQHSFCVHVLEVGLQCAFHRDPVHGALCAGLQGR